MALRFQTLIGLLRHFGPSWLLYRWWYATEIQRGVLRHRLPATTWSREPLAALLTDPRLASPETYRRHRERCDLPFFFSAGALERYRPHFAAWDGATTPLAVADDVTAGYLKFFEHHRVRTGFPPAWHANAVSGRQLPADRHWTEIGDFDAGDIKLVWEPSRFAFVFALVRAYWRTGDERYATAFWELVESWRAENPPQCGANWKCGQEIAFRVMAWCFGLHGFWTSRHSTPERITQLAQMIAVSGRRIEANVKYALSQRNNHAVSEATGLWTIGLLFPEFQAAAQWKDLGAQLLERLGRDLIYPDGAFSQHSMNYQRVMLHAYLWSARLGELHGRPFSAELRGRIRAAGEFLYQQQDETAGAVPCCGQNDGALILPLNNCRYGDFRPVVQATSFLTEGRRRFREGPWDEDLLWLYGPESLSATVKPTPRHDLSAPYGGHFTLRTERGFALVRAPHFRHRPAQADLLHVDLWWRGQNIALDAGTYSYNAPAPWNNPLAHTEYHNTIGVDGRDQMDRCGRFLWFPWPRGTVHAHVRSDQNHLACWVGEHDGYMRLPDPVRCRRAVVQIGPDHWLIADRLEARKRHAYRLHWLLLDVPYKFNQADKRLRLDTPTGPYGLLLHGDAGAMAASVVRADPHQPRGWRSPTYNCREPAISLSLTAEAECVFFWTLFGPAECALHQDRDFLRVDAADWQATLKFSTPSNPALIESVRVEGAIQDFMTLRH